MKPTRELLELVKAGAHLDLTNVTKPLDDLIHLATAAAERGVRITIQGNKPTSQLVKIIEAGGGKVTVAWPETKK